MHPEEEEGESIISKREKVERRGREGAMDRGKESDRIKKKGWMGQDGLWVEYKEEDRGATLFTPCQCKSI